MQVNCCSRFFTLTWRPCCLHFVGRYTHTHTLGIALNSCTKQRTKRLASKASQYLLNLRNELASFMRIVAKASIRSKYTPTIPAYFCCLLGAHGQSNEYRHEIKSQRHAIISVTGHTALTKYTICLFIFLLSWLSFAAVVII